MMLVKNIIKLLVALIGLIAILIMVIGAPAWIIYIYLCNIIIYNSIINNCIAIWCISCPFLLGIVLSISYYLLRNKGEKKYYKIKKKANITLITFIAILMILLIIANINPLLTRYIYSGLAIIAIINVLIGFTLFIKYVFVE